MSTTIVRIVELWCDGPGCGEQFDAIDRTAPEIKAAGKRAGWHVGRRHDYCPTCVAQHNWKMNDPREGR